MKPADFYASLSNQHDRLPELGAQRYVLVESAADYATKFPAKPHGYEGEGMYNRRSGYMMDQVQRPEPVAPMVMRDTPEYISPVTERPVDGRAARREDLKRHDCYEIDPPRRPRGFKNPAWAAKHGLRVNEHCDARNIEAEKAKLAAMPRGKMKKKPN